MDVITLTQELLRFPSVTPNQAGCLDYLETLLSSYGFRCWRRPYGDVDNLFALYDTQRPGRHFSFAGHIDVVPVGDEATWRFPPFSAACEEGTLYGRGVVDMKGAIAAFIAAWVRQRTTLTQGKVSLLLTSDEEGPGIDGTRAVLPWLQAEGMLPDLCLVGEPTNPHQVGEMIKVGRRGSLNAHLTVQGRAGHVAYPDLALNPIPALLFYLQELMAMDWDVGDDYFQPTHCEVTTVDVGNSVSNVIPQHASAAFNIRFNTAYTPESLAACLTELSALTQATYPDIRVDLDISCSGGAFWCPSSELISLVRESVEHVCGITPLLSTSGGTSDARFIKDYCPVIEFGLISATAHHTDEHIHISEIEKLCQIYEQILMRLPFL